MRAAQWFSRGAPSDLGLLLLVAVGCSSPPPPPLVVKILVQSDPGVPLSGAKLLYAGKPAGTTNGNGVAELTLRGEDGQSFDLSVECPDGFKSPGDPLSVTLRRLVEPKKVPLYEASCPPTTRSVVVAVAADKGPNLPVMYLGREVARTDSSGAANVLLQVAPGEQFSLTLATTEKGAEALRPQNPVATFGVKDSDDVFVFTPRFTVEQPRRVVYRPRPTGPTLLKTAR